MPARVKIELDGYDEAVKAFDNLEESEARRKQAFTQANKAFRDQEQAASQAGKASKKLGDDYNNLSNLAKKAGAAILAAFALDKIKDFTGEIVKTTATFQKFEAVLTNTLGSKSEAQKALRDINDFAANTPFGVEELTESFVKLANAGFKPTTEEMRKLGDLASATGKSFDQLVEGILDAQSFEFERLKEFGIKASQAGDKVSFTFKGVTTTVAKTNDAVRAYVLSLGDLQGVSGGMAAISRTLGGQISNLEDSFGQLQLAIGERLGEAFSSVVGYASEFISLLKDFIQIPVAQQLENERSELNILTTALTNNNIKQEEKQAIINELTAKYPDFVKNIDLNTASEKQLKEAVAAANREYDKRILLAASDDIRKKYQEQSRGILDEEVKIQKRIAELRAGTAKQGIFGIGGEIKDQKIINDLVATNVSNLERLRAKRLGLTTLANEEIKAYEKQLNLSEEQTRVESNRDAVLQKMLDAKRKQLSDELALEQKKAEDSKKLAEKQAKENEKLAKEKLKAESEAFINEKEADRDLREAQLKQQIDIFKRLADSKTASQAEIVEAERVVSNLEIALAESAAQRKLFVYELDKDNRVQQKQLTKNEIAIIETELATEESKIRSGLVEKLRQIDDDANKEREKSFKASIDFAKGQMDEWQEKYKQSQEEATKKQKEEAEKRKQIEQAASQFFIGLVNIGFEFEKQTNETRLQNIQIQKENELKIAGDNEQSKAIVQAKYAEQERQIKERQARADKAKAIFDIAINTARAVIQALPNIPLSVVIGSLGAIQLGLVASKPIPKFRQGVERFDGLGSETSDSNLAYLSKNERVVTAQENRDYWDTLTAIHNRKIEPSILNDFVNGKLNHKAVIVEKSSNDKALQIALGEVAKLRSALEKQQKNTLVIDKQGFNIYEETQTEKRKILNDKYNS